METVAYESSDSNEEIFLDRHHAGRCLAYKLGKILQEEGTNPQEVVVVALSPGGVPIAEEVALTLECPIKVLLPEHKQTKPEQKPLSANPYWNEAASIGQAPDNLIRSHRLVTKTPDPDLTDRLVILIDDSVVTGTTATTALSKMRGQRPLKLMLAVPVLSLDARPKLEKACDEVIALFNILHFSAAELYYHDFHHVDKEEVLDCLRIACEQE